MSRKWAPLIIDALAHVSNDCKDNEGEESMREPMKNDKEDFTEDGMKLEEEINLDLG